MCYICRMLPSLHILQETPKEEKYIKTCTGYLTKTLFVFLCIIGMTTFVSIFKQDVSNVPEIITLPE